MMSASAWSIWRWMSLRCTQGKIERWHQTLKNRASDWKLVWFPTFYIVQGS